MATRNLTDRYVQSLKGGDKRYYISDGQAVGLRVWVSKAGKKKWSLATRDAQGRMRQFFAELPYPNMGLSDARQWAIETRAHVKSGGDPSRERKEAIAREAEQAERQRAEEQAAGVTLDKLVDEYERYLAGARRSWTSGEAPRRIRDVFKSVLTRPVAEIGLTEIEDALLAHKSRSSASRARQYLAPVFDWAGGQSRKSRQRGRHRAEKLDVIDVHEAIDPQPQDQRGIRMRNLSDHEVASILPHLTKTPSVSMKSRGPDEVGQQISMHGLVMRFLLLSAARLGEVTTMRWGDVDRAQELWTKRGVKNTSGQRDRDDQVLPLSSAMRELLLELPHEGRAKDELVFKSHRGGALSNWDRETKRIQRLSGTENWHRHDLREWAATTMAKKGVAIDVYERILNHALSSGSAARRHYDRYARLEEQREALELLAGRVGELGPD